MRLVAAASREQQRDHLQRLAEPHVVGKARAKADPRQEAEPARANFLVRPQRRLQRLSGQRRGEHLGTAAGGERLGKPGSRLHFAPRFRSGRRLACVNVGAGDEPHRLPERNALGAREALDFRVAVERSFQLGGIDFDPLAAQQREPVAGGDEAANLFRRQRLTVERHLDGEIEQIVGADERGRSGADGRLDRRAARPVRRPGRWHAHDEPRLLERVDVVEQPHRLFRRPAQRMKDFAGVDDLLEPIAGFAGATDRFEELEQFGFSAGARIFAQRRAERRVAERAMRRESRDVSRKKRERPLGVFAVFGEMEMHAADEPPAAVARGEERADGKAALGALDVERLAQRTP